MAAHGGGHRRFAVQLSAVTARQEPYHCIIYEERFVRDPFVRITMNLHSRRNALSLDHLRELLAAMEVVSASNATGVVLAANGPVFSAGHDFRDLAGASLESVQELVGTCTELMLAISRMPQVVIASVHALATAAGCQLVAACDLAVAAESASFALPGGKGGWFCTTPLVAVGRNLPRKRAAELAFTGDPIDAHTAEAWGLVNRVVPDDELDAAVLDLLRRATRGSAASKAIGKEAFSIQMGLPLAEAYEYATDVMARASQHPDAQEGVTAFLEKRKPKFTRRR